MPTARRAALTIAMSTIIAGCATSPDLPTGSSIPSDGLETFATLAASPSGGTGVGASGSFYPLQLGNHWTFRTLVAVTIIPTLGDPAPPYLLDGMSDRRLVCVERRDGRDYVVEESSDLDPVQPTRTWNRFRQDRTGLYESDVSFFEPPPCGAGHAGGSTASRSGTVAGFARGVEQLVPLMPAAQQTAHRAAAERLGARLAIVDRVLRRTPAAPSQASGPGLAAAGELTRLRYPLYPGARWTIRADVGVTFTAIVEGPDVLNLSVCRLRGYRIRITSDFLGPNDVVRAWYGPSGYLQLVAHLEADVIDVFQQVVGRQLVDQRETLIFLDLVRPAFAFTPIGPLGSADTSGGPPR